MRWDSTAESSLAWNSMGISLTSSKNSVPPWASSNLPGAPSRLPGRASGSQPKSSCSSISRCSAAQFITTKGPEERLPALCMAWAIISLPVPDSPSMSMFPS